MLKSVTITNYRGESVVYKIEGVDVNDNNGLLITSIDGLGPVKADINMTKLVTSDGSIFNSARLEPRNIVIEARFTNAKSIEDARQMSYKFFPIKKQLTIRVETDNRIAETTGYVESNEPNIFSDESDVQISILCESAFFYSPDKDVTTFSGVDPKFEFVYENAYSETVEETYSKYFNAREIIGATPYFVHGTDDQGREAWSVADENIGKVKIFYNTENRDLKSITITNRRKNEVSFLCNDGTEFAYGRTFDGNGDWFTYVLPIPATQKTDEFGFVSEGVLTYDMLISIPYLEHGYNSESDDYWTMGYSEHVGELLFTTDLSSSKLYELGSIECTDSDNEVYKFTSTYGDVFEGITCNVNQVGFYAYKRVLVPGIDKQTNFGDIIFKKVASVTYTGDSEIGCIIELHAIGTATNVTVYNMYTGERMRIDTDKITALTGKGIVAGDTITICTIVGKKSITLLREGVNINILNALSKNTDWITLSKGDNVLGITADYGDQNIQFTVTSQVAYEGV